MAKGVLVLLAHRWDATAQRLAEQWRPLGVRRMTPEDLSFPGWRLRVGDGEGMAVCGGDTLPTDRIDGVYSRMSRVYRDDLPHIVADDREYVAAEMNAFLAAWLAALPCPMLNRPRANSLSGPPWRQEQWLHAAAGLGIPVRPLRRRVERAGAVPAVEGERAEGGVRVTVVGGRTMGGGDERLHGYARRLARHAGVDLLAARFAVDGAAGYLLAVDALPEVDEETGEAIGAYFAA